jgi:hypothetical protein
VLLPVSLKIKMYIYALFTSLFCHFLDEDDDDDEEDFEDDDEWDD